MGSVSDTVILPAENARTEPGPRRVAAIDLGTVSSRLALATVEGGRVVGLEKRTVITDLGEGVDATGRFAPAAIERVLAACGEFCELIDRFGAHAVCATATSAARDAQNGEDLLAGLRDMGLCPQVIPGEVEARLTFYGVAHDFRGERLLVADSGGGSTELAHGAYIPGRPLVLGGAVSLDVGCRRVTERFFSALPPKVGELESAASFAHEIFSPHLSHAVSRPERLVAVGGTVTTLVAMVHELAVYDSRFVHLRELTFTQVDAAISRLARLDADQIATLPGIQPKRAPVILAGAVIIRELMRAGGYEALTVSENSLLAGMIATMDEVLSGRQPAIGWTPRLSC